MALQLQKTFKIEGRKKAKWSDTSQKALSAIKIKLSRLIRLKCCTHVKNCGSIKTSIKTIYKGIANTLKLSV
jgi:hypothetical protein